MSELGSFSDFDADAKDVCFIPTNGRPQPDWTGALHANNGLRLDYFPIHLHML
jgi:hypothetical protein